MGTRKAYRFLEISSIVSYGKEASNIGKVMKHYLLFVHTWPQKTKPTVCFVVVTSDAVGAGKRKGSSSVDIELHC